MAAVRRSSALIKLLVGGLILAGAGLLFVRTLDDARSEPYTVRAGDLSGWTLVADEMAPADRPLVLLTPPPEMPMRLFRQVFARAGESLSTPNAPGIGLVLAGELRETAVSMDQVLALAREAGLERARLTPRCMAYRRESQPGSTRQLYFVVFDMPEFDTFRAALRDRVSAGGSSGLEARRLSPVMMLAAAPDFTRWMPIAVDPERDCLASVEIE